MKNEFKYDQEKLNKLIPQNDPDHSNTLKNLEEEYYRVLNIAKNFYLNPLVQKAQVWYKTAFPDRVLNLYNLLHAADYNADKVLNEILVEVHGHLFKEKQPDLVNQTNKNDKDLNETL